MKPRRIKEAVLVLLSCVLIYIWWGNFQRFLGKQESYQYEEEQVPTASQQVAKRDKLLYRPPQVNPFRRSVGQPSGNASRATLTPPKPAPEVLHTSHRLTGILPKGKNSQVIVLTPQSKSVVLELGDSLGTWMLSGTGEAFAVFRQGKRYDTLWLGATKN